MVPAIENAIIVHFRVTNTSQKQTFLFYKIHLQQKCNFTIMNKTRKHP